MVHSHTCTSFRYPMKSPPLECLLAYLIQQYKISIVLWSNTTVAIIIKVSITNIYELLEIVMLVALMTLFSVGHAI